MARAISLKTLAEKKYKTFDFSGTWQEVFGNPEKGSLWLIYGNEKNGKTTFSLKLAEYLSKFEKVLYVSAEEGVKKSFQSAVTQKANIDLKNANLKIIGFETLETIGKILSKRQSPKVIFIDNITVYLDELMYGKFRNLMISYPGITFVFLAHEDDSGKPYSSTAKLCSKLADFIINVVGLTANVTSRDSKGGTIIINEEKAALYHGTKILTS